MPVGGDSNGGTTGCHTGTPNYPDLTPLSECEWDTGACTPPDFNDCNSCHGDPVGTGMTGVDLSKEVMRLRPDLPIILCTGHSSLVSEESAKEIGIKAFAIKPVGIKHLATMVRQALDEN